MIISSIIRPANLSILSIEYASHFDNSSSSVSFSLKMYEWIRCIVFCCVLRIALIKIRLILGGQVHHMPFSPRYDTGLFFLESVLSRGFLVTVGVVSSPLTIIHGLQHHN